MSKNVKHVLVLFSGGLDSTYLVYKNLKEGNKVSLLYVTLTNNKDKTIYEKQAKNRLIEMFKSEGYTFENIYDQIEILLDNNSNLVFSQVLVWLFGAAYSCANLDEINVGYVMYDGAISYLPEITKIWNSFKGLSYGNTFPTLKFPLRKWSKCDIMNDIPDKYAELVVNCEHPYITEKKFIPCGNCPTCLNYAALLKEEPNRYSRLKSIYGEVQRDESVETISTVKTKRKVKRKTPANITAEFEL